MFVWFSGSFQAPSSKANGGTIECTIFTCLTNDVTKPYPLPPSAPKVQRAYRSKFRFSGQEPLLQILQITSPLGSVFRTWTQGGHHQNKSSTGFDTSHIYNMKYFGKVSESNLLQNNHKLRILMICSSWKIKWKSFDLPALMAYGTTLCPLFIWFANSLRTSLFCCLKGVTLSAVSQLTWVRNMFFAVGIFQGETERVRLKQWCHKPQESRDESTTCLRGANDEVQTIIFLYIWGLMVSRSFRTVTPACVTSDLIPQAPNQISRALNFLNQPKRSSTKPCCAFLLARTAARLLVTGG